MKFFYEECKKCCFRNILVEKLQKSCFRYFFSWVYKLVVTSFFSHEFSKVVFLIFLYEVTNKQ